MKLLLKVFASLIICLTLACAQAALADDLYRCGNTYQDTPCKGVVSRPINEKPFKQAPIDKPMNKSAAPASKKVMADKTATTANIDECKKRGEAVKFIIKLREAGVTADDQIAIAADAAAVARIKDAYSRSGSAFQVQNAVERECMQQQQKITLTSKWMTQARRILGLAPVEPTVKTADVKPRAKPQVVAINKPALAKSAPAQAVPNQAPDETQPAPTAMPSPPIPAQQSAPVAVIQPEPVAPPAAVAEPGQPEPAPVAQAVAQKEQAQDDSQGMCTSLKAGLKNIADQKRKGGNAAMMKDLKDQQNNLEGVMQSAGC